MQIMKTSIKFLASSVALFALSQAPALATGDHGAHKPAAGAAANRDRDPASALSVVLRHATAATLEHCQHRTGVGRGLCRMGMA